VLDFPLTSTDGLVVLALGAHPDDIEIGCAGTVLQLAVAGATVHYCVLTGTPARAAEARAAARRLTCEDDAVRVHQLPDGRLPAHWEQVKDLLEELSADVTPDLVLGPRVDDAHQDHRTLAEVVPTVFRSATVLGYEIHKLDGDRGRCNAYVPLDDAVLQKKWDLLDTSFPSQHGRAWWDREVIAGLARLRGVEARARYAEGFTCSKTVLRIVAG
jgi:LmbE family N-acetylglucosaminyl deacetylase